MRFVDRLTVGSAYYSRLLDDEDIAQAQEEKGLPPATRPPLRGFTSIHHTLYDLIDITMQVNSSDPAKVRGLPRPQTARERIRKRAREQHVFDIVTKSVGREVPAFAPRG